MATLEERIGNRILELLNAPSSALDALVAGTSPARNIELSSKGHNLTDPARVPGHAAIRPLTPEPVREFGQYHNAKQTRYRFEIEWRLRDDLERGRLADKLHAAVEGILGPRRAFFTALTEPESNLLARDGNIEIDPHVRERRDGDVTAVTMTVSVTVAHKLGA